MRNSHSLGCTSSCCRCSGEVDLLPTPRRTALLAAFGVTEAAAPDRFLITLGVLR
jgi:hypothetical protein